MRMLSHVPVLRLLATSLSLLLLLLPGVIANLVAAGAAVLVPEGALREKSSAHHQLQHQPTIKVLVCGDSISQGREFDFTWRYRLWEWFQEQHQQQHPTTPALQYVGPYNGTLPASIPPELFDPDVPQTWGAYHPTVSPAFWPGLPSQPPAAGAGSAHFAVYGRPAWQDIDALAAQVRAYAPDVVVLHLGFNDLSWWEATPDELARYMQLLVFNARLGRPGVTVLVADVSHRLRVGTRPEIPAVTAAYNALLRAKVAEWTLPGSEVVLVAVSEEYDCHVDACPAGIDGLHPNALGDFQIARAYTIALHAHFGFGGGPLVVPPRESIPGLEEEGEEGEEQEQEQAQAQEQAQELAQELAQARRRLQHPPVAIFVGVSGMCLVAVVALRRSRRRARWSPLPMTANE